MGQKIHPVGLRLGITRTWESRWFEKKNYKAWLHEDASIRKYFGRLTRAAGISKVEIERRANQARVIVHTAKPGIIIGKRGVGIEDIRKSLEHLTQKNVQVNVVEIKHPELDARLVGQNIVDQLEKRIAFRRAMKQSIMRTMKAGARGVKVMVSGRLGGAEIARSAQDHDGKVPLHTLRADIDYAHVEAFTTFGRIGVKVWIYKGEVLPDAPRPEARQPDRPVGERATFRDRRNDRRGTRGRGGAPGVALPTAGEIEHDHSSLVSDIDGAPGPTGQHSTGPHGGEATHDPAAQHGHGVTAETSVVDPASQGTVDTAERPWAGEPAVAAAPAPATALEASAPAPATAPEASAPSAAPEASAPAPAPAPEASAPAPATALEASAPAPATAPEASAPSTAPEASAPAPAPAPEASAPAPANAPEASAPQASAPETTEPAVTQSEPAPADGAAREPGHEA
jgi:small subunit ribosomal protein S3